MHAVQRLRSIALLFVVAAGFLLTPHASAAADPYSVQVLTAPVGAGLSADSRTIPFAMNNKGQVFGEAFASPGDRRPVLWTGGVPMALTVPDGYVWNDDGNHFLNDHGTAIGRVDASNPDRALIIRWRNSGADVDIVPLPPVPPISPCASDYALAFGLNNLGHILMESGDAGGHCHLLWIWDGTGSASADFSLVTPVTDGQNACTPVYSLRIVSGGSHLNDADHVAIEHGPHGGPNPMCPAPWQSGILANGSFTPVITSPVSGGSLGINNNDQMIIAIGTSADLKFWNGSSIVDLGTGAASMWLNSLGHVAFSEGPIAHPTPRVYRNGVTTDVWVPAQIPGFFLDFSTGVGASGLNRTGQILLDMGFDVGGPSGAFTEHPVLLTPTLPVLTLKVNGQHPNPPIVHTDPSGAMTLTLDLSASEYTAPLSWYWALVVNNQLVWVTAGGLSSTPAPLFVAPPVAIATAPLLNITLPPATTLASLFFLVDEGGSAVAFDVVAATRP